MFNPDYIVQYMGFLKKITFFELQGCPILVIWVVLTWIFCSLRFRFVQFRYFFHAFTVFSRKYSKDKELGYLNHIQSFFNAIAGTVGLGTIAGVVIAISLGGAGSVGWMVIAGFFAMPCKFAEAVLGLKYRINENGVILGSLFHYVEHGLRNIGFSGFARFNAALCAILMLTALCAAIAFQANQSVAIFKLGVHINNYVLSFLFVASVFIVIIGGVTKIASLTATLVPFMVCLHLLMCCIVIFCKSDNIINVMHLIFSGMFSGKAVVGGGIGAFCAGIRRAVFSSEAGVGTVSIAHAVTRDKDPIRTGLVAMLEPCVDTILMCSLTGVAFLSVTGGEFSSEGIVAVKKAFGSVYPFFGVILTLVALLFGFSSVLSYSYYCEVCWIYVFRKNVSIVRFLVLCCVLTGCLYSESIFLATLSDILFMCVTVPNMTAVCFLSGEILASLKRYKKTPV